LVTPYATWHRIEYKRIDAEMTETTQCPACESPYGYEDSGLFICPECAHEWIPGSNRADDESEKIVRDANGTILQDGDTVTVIKDLKIKGSSNVVKVGTKVKSIRLVNGDHDIDCKIPGIGAMGLKSEFVRKVTD
jgi:protein PhnA